MTTTTTTTLNLKRLPNYQVEKAISEKLNFVNYNGSISGHLDEKGIYSVIHWRTLIWQFDTTKELTLVFNFDYYSQTTSALQGRIIRTMTTREVDWFLGDYKTQGDAKKFRRFKGMARLQ
jgi:hypothetical protein